MGDYFTELYTDIILNVSTVSKSIEICNLSQSRSKSKEAGQRL